MNDIPATLLVFIHLYNSIMKDLRAFEKDAISISERQYVDGGWFWFRKPRLGTRTFSFSGPHRSVNQTVSLSEDNGVYTMSFVGSANGPRGSRSWDFSRTFSFGWF